MLNASYLAMAILWIVFWGTVGGFYSPRVYARKDLDVSQARLGGAAIGAALGPFGLIPLWIVTPAISKFMLSISTLIIVGIVALAFARTFPENLCVTNPSFVASQLTNGIVIGLIYGSVQLVMGSSPWALLTPVLTTLTAGLVYTSTLVGQGLAADEMYLLRVHLDECLAEAEARAATRTQLRQHS